MTKRYNYLAFFSLILLSFSSLAQPMDQLANYLGTGDNPRLQLVLSDQNGPGWGSYTIDYQGIGNIPDSSNPSNNWSPWNVMDTAGHYYGTIDLKSTINANGTVTTEWGDYKGGDYGYLQGVHFNFNNNIHAWQLTADGIVINDPNAPPAPPAPGQLGPFPNTPLATPAVYKGTNQPIKFSVNGASIVNDKGQPIILKGMVRPSLEWNNQGQYLTEDDFKNMHAWGANAVRLDLYQGNWFASGPATQIGSYKQIINAIVYYATQNDMAVILDLHWTVNGSQSPMANQDSLKFWQQVATDYKDFGTVIFELYNEPYGIDQNTWLNGNNEYVGYQQLYNTVRATGAQNICIVNGLDYAYDLSFVNDNFKVNGTNIVYGSHPYDEKGMVNINGVKVFQPNYAGILGKYPLIFTEFGVNQSNYFPNGYQAIYNNIINYADQNHINYTGFAWWVNNPGDPNTFPDLIKDWNGTPLNGGVMVHDDMQASPGSNLGM
jgi:hypothetical protein